MTVLVPAAQYLRMSTEHQQYSLDNQSDAIAEYAARHGFAVVQTYADRGKSGLVLKSRTGLSNLLRDVVAGQNQFRAILVYDISRWGRFQDADEAAHYEFICKSAGVPVYYCAEQFPNDGTLAASVLKAIKRSMAGEFSRELGVRTLAGQRRLIRAGFWAGGSAGYGMTRMLVSADGRAKGIARGNKPRWSADHVVLAPGNRREVQTIRRIFSIFIKSKGKQTPAAIARQLNCEHVPFLDGRPWSGALINRLLKHPKYSGCNAWGRTTQRLHRPVRQLPPEQWIVKPAAFSAIVEAAVFEKAQQILRRIHTRRSDEQHLARLRALYLREGRLTKAIIDRSPLVGGSATYTKHFGSLRRAYELVGYIQAWRDRQAKLSSKMVIDLRERLVQELVARFPTHIQVFRLGRRRKRPVLRIDGGLAVSFIVGRHYRTPSGKSGWKIHPVSAESMNLTLLCLLNRQNDGFAEFYLAPHLHSPLTQMKFGSSSEWLNGLTRLLDLSDFYSKVVDLASSGGQSMLSPHPRRGGRP